MRRSSSASLGQPLFAAELHHLEQARCRNCGELSGPMHPPNLLEGVGTSYIVYDWSACAMLVVMHYFAAAPFKRLESLHEGWGIPLADANLWRVVDETDDILAPALPRARATTGFRMRRAENRRHRLDGGGAGAADSGGGRRARAHR